MKQLPIIPGMVPDLLHLPPEVTGSPTAVRG